MSTDIPLAYNSDLPIQKSAEDQYEFVPFANHVIDEIFSGKQPESIVVGLSGLWGSGKTSLLNLMDERLDYLKTKDKSVTKIRYVPWRVKNRDALITSFLTLLVEKIAEDMNKNRSLKSNILDGLEPVKKYAQAMAQFESGIKLVVQMLSALKVPYVESVFENFAAIRAALAEEAPKDIEELHQNAYKALKKLEISTVVMIDDLDRLEPSEIIDMLRLVRATAQLPYVTFILCYDHKNVCDAIETVLKVDGTKFLGKLVQLPISVPCIPNDYLLTNIKSNLNKTFMKADTDIAKEEIVKQTIESIFTTKIIKTPRDINRITNSLIFRNTLTEDSNLQEIICLAVLESMFPELYNWINDNILRDTYYGVKKINYKPIIENYEKLISIYEGDQDNLAAVRVIVDILTSNQNGD